MRALSIIITVICLTPILLVFGGWVFTLSSVEQETWNHIRTTVLDEYVMGSLMLMLGVAILAGIIGITCAWCITRYDFPLRDQFAWMLILPFAMPSYILAMSYGNFLDYAGPVQSILRELFQWERGYYFPQIRSTGGAVLILSLATFPYIYLMARSAFESQNVEWTQLAEVFGKNSSFSFFRLSFGAARPFIAVGVSLAVIETAADIGVAELFGVPTVATGLYRQWFFGDNALVGARLASILVLIAAILIAVERFSRKRARFSTDTGTNKVSRVPIAGVKGISLTITIFIPILVGFVIPLLWIMRLAIYNSRLVDFEKIWSATGDSLWLCFCGAVVTIVAALIIAFAEREGKKPSFQWVASLGYAVPGVVIAISLLIVQQIVQDIFDLRMLMTGSIFGLLLAYLIRFFSPAYQNIQSGLARISLETDMMAKSFGKSRWDIFSQIYLPLLRSPIFYALMLVGIDIFKELPASLILRPFDVNTLAITVFEFAGDDRPAEAAPYALVMIAIAVISSYILVILQRRNHD